MTAEGLATLPQWIAAVLGALTFDSVGGWHLIACVAVWRASDIAVAWFETARDVKIAQVDAAARRREA